MLVNEVAKPSFFRDVAQADGLLSDLGETARPIRQLGGHTGDAMIGNHLVNFETGSFQGLRCR
jgi:hypothetical protein